MSIQDRHREVVGGREPGRFRVHRMSHLIEGSEWRARGARATVNALSIDLEDWFCVAKGFTWIFDASFETVNQARMPRDRQTTGQPALSYDAVLLRLG